MEYWAKLHPEVPFCMFSIIIWFYICVCILILTFSFCLLSCDPSLHKTQCLLYVLSEIFLWLIRMCAIHTSRNLFHPVIWSNFLYLVPGPSLYLIFVKSVPNSDSKPTFCLLAIQTPLWDIISSTHCGYGDSTQQSHFLKIYSWIIRKKNATVGIQWGYNVSCTLL